MWVGLSQAKNKLAAIELKIQELMREREDLLYEIEDRKAVVEITQQEINASKQVIEDRWSILKKR